MKKMIPMIVLVGLAAAPALAATTSTNGGNTRTMANAPAAPTNWPSSEYYFKKMDTNHDGMVSQAEQDAYYQNMRRDADTNHDGQISASEFQIYNISQKDEYQSKGEREDKNKDRSENDNLNNTKELSPSAGKRASNY